MIGALTTALLMLWPIVSRILEVEPIVDLLQWLIAVLPLIIVAVALVLLAAATGNLVAELVQPHTTERQIGWMPGVVRVVIMVFGAPAALDLLEIRFAEDIVKILMASGGIALAVAFGIGGIDTDKQRWAKVGPQA